MRELDKEKIRHLYLKGHNAKEISILLKVNFESVRKCISRNFAHLKDIHKKNSDSAVDKVKELYSEGYNAREIADILNKEANTVKLYIYRNCVDLKNIHKKNNEKVVDIETVKRLYTKGYKAKEIADILNKEANTVNLCIYRNCVDLKNIHKENRIIRKDTLKLLDRHNKTHISDSSFLKYNRQSYENDRNGNLKFNDKRGLKPYDIPKKYKKKIY
ncbi:hypothetical protein KGF42_08565 [Clostridioides sp. ZZV15-6383]|uniref:hypothetical protein n=1 Tax=Clostridioides sp. ZZV15-6383 TaxID=2811498 RepID=UPI001D0F9270|nr:hypothetical protein [Clostridioides sp. ZZV15-6383]